MDETKPKPDYSWNLLAFYALILFTIGEFILGISATSNIAALMILFGLGKAYFIVTRYMNIGRLFSDEEEHA